MYDKSDFDTFCIFKNYLDQKIIYNLQFKFLIMLISLQRIDMEEAVTTICLSSSNL